MSIKNILFDLDGTLVDSYPGIYACFKYALNKMGKEIPSDDFLKQCLGPPLDYSFREFFKMNERDVAEGVRLYRERYAVKGVYELSPIAGAAECLKKLYAAGYNLLLATSKPEPFARIAVETLGVTSLFSVICGSDFEVRLKNKTDVINEAVRRGKINREESCMVGDRKYDMVGAKNCSLKAVGIRLGYADEGELEESGADIIVSDFVELYDKIGLI